MKLLKRILIVFIILIITGCYTNNDNESISSQTKTDTNVEQPQTKKKYTTSKDEYRNYIDNLIEKLNVSDKFSLFSIKWSSPYVKVNYYEIGNLDDETFETEKNNIINAIYSELEKNEYKSGGMFETDYEYISIGFYKNYGNNDYRLKTFEQIDVYDF